VLRLTTLRQECLDRLTLNPATKSGTSRATLARRVHQGPTRHR
jgi:hypothetical protein